MTTHQVGYRPDESEKVDEVIASTFSERVDKARRFVLIVASAGLLLGLAGAEPGELSTLGIKIALTPWLLFAAVLAVLLYAAVRFWFVSRPEAAAAHEMRRSHGDRRILIGTDSRFAHLPIRLHGLRSESRFRMWYFLEYRAPIFVAIAAAIALSLRLLILIVGV